MSAHIQERGPFWFARNLAGKLGKTQAADGETLAGVPVYIDGDGDVAVMTDADTDGAQPCAGVVIEAGVEGDRRMVYGRGSRGAFRAAADLPAGTEYLTAGEGDNVGLGFVAHANGKQKIIRLRQKTATIVKAGRFVEGTILIGGE